MSDPVLGELRFLLVLQTTSGSEDWLKKTQKNPTNKHTHTFAYIYVYLESLLSFPNVFKQAAKFCGISVTTWKIKMNSQTWSCLVLMV